ncbi:helix-turn-helix domain-containing protein [Nonomuraea turkmeniaca]|uniref:Helix-turn-helix domain-containing protein n=1 Tax=Nonomuraea turkmeniaca TaxID=103838 RepID=A0A5S4FL84_9ACTN|nr:helix-turn-helix domain-containing protein [Nonomuraea turkmeniaca]TMR21486.1 helix-turn-helix domain-containing protein [Nonomuraea turkmeniaca]
MHRVAILALEGVYPFELSIPQRIFSLAAGADGEPLYEVLTCGVSRTVRTNAGFSIMVEHEIDVIATAHTVVIAPFTGAAEDVSDWLPAPVAEALARLSPGVRLVSICTAAFVLAAAGLLDGRPATTHWNEADRFRRMFPKVVLDADVLFTDDGDVLTSAGVASGIDLCLHLVRRDHGAEVANRVARRCVVPPWREGGQAQYVERPVPAMADSSTSATRAWALERLQRPISLQEMAAHARMSVRTFLRRFRDEVGMTPGQWLTQQRVELARRLLETTDLTVDRIAAEAGFGTGASLRQHLTAALGVSPTAYRQTFRLTEPAV